MFSLAARCLAAQLRLPGYGQWPRNFADAFRHNKKIQHLAWPNFGAPIAFLIFVTTGCNRKVHPVVSGINEVAISAAATL